MSADHFRANFHDPPMFHGVILVVDHTFHIRVKILILIKLSMDTLHLAEQFNTENKITN
jgi:hypothetical protein